MSGVLILIDVKSMTNYLEQDHKNVLNTMYRSLRNHYEWGVSLHYYINVTRGEQKGIKHGIKAGIHCNCICEVHYKTQLIKSIIRQRNEFKIYTMPIQNTLFIYTHTKKK